MLEKMIKFGKGLLSIIMAFVTFWFVDLWSTLIINEFFDYRTWAFDHQALMLTLIIIGNVLLTRFYYYHVLNSRKEEIKE